MKLATAFVEIAARTDEFRRQLREARELAAASADAIRRSFETPPSLVPGAVASEHGPAIRRASEPRTSEPRTSEPRFDSPPMPGPLRPPGATAASNGRSGASNGAFAELLGLLSPANAPVVIPAMATPRSAGDAARDRLGDSRNADTAALLRQQIELERKEVDLLSKQLAVLEEVRQGIPAILT